MILSLFYYGGKKKKKKIKKEYEKKDVDGNDCILLSKLQRDTRERRRGLSIMGISIGIVFLILLVLHLTNPTIRDVREHIASKNMKSQIINIEIYDEIIYSAYVVDLEGDEKERHFYIGALNHIYRLSKKFEKFAIKELEIQKQKEKKKN